MLQISALSFVFSALDGQKVPDERRERRFYFPVVPVRTLVYAAASAQKSVSAGTSAASVQKSVPADIPAAAGGIPAPDTHAAAPAVLPFLPGKDTNRLP